MAKMRPELSEIELNNVQSSAEARFYRACRDQLPDDILVIYSAAWVYRRKDGNTAEGEADFTLFFSKFGFITVEIKGGGIQFEPTNGQWSSIDRSNNKHPIKDPFRQATSEKFAVLDQLKGHSNWSRYPGKRILAGHAVFFPDCDDLRGLIATNSPAEILGGRKNLKDLIGWFEKVNRFWQGNSTIESLGSQGLRLAETIFCSTILVKPLLAADIDHEEELRINLTNQQAKILRIIGGRKRAVISGGAGTGKTLIAVEKARQLAVSGQKVLFLCYNRPLADHLRLALSDVANVQILSFHQLCEKRIDLSLKLSGRDIFKEACEAYPNQDRFQVQMPFSLALSNEILDERFDVIIVDEAQDFSDEYWFSIEELLVDQANSYFFIFTDPNQSVYRRHGSLPIKEEPFLLTANCRNTSYIHAAAYQYYTGVDVDAPSIVGEPVETLCEATISAQARVISQLVGRLVGVDGVNPNDIVILLARSRHPGPANQVYFSALDTVNHQTRVKFEFGGGGTLPGSVFVDTVNRFKGLERQVVILWLADGLDEDEDKETFYVGISRAKARLFVMGPKMALSTFDAGT